VLGFSFAPVPTDPRCEGKLPKADATTKPLSFESSIDSRNAFPSPSSPLCCMCRRQNPKLLKLR
jgi:hypothetical protein